MKFRFVDELSGLIEAELGSSRDQINLHLFRAICNVRTLKLRSNVIDALNNALDDDDGQLPVFHNLSCLVFSETNHSCWKALLCLLNCTQKIEFLSIEMSTRFEEEEFNEEEEDEEEEEVNEIAMYEYVVPPSSLQYLKRLEIGFKEVEDYETMELVMYLLRYTSALEKLLVQVPDCTSNFEALRLESELYEYLSELP
ncbi:uncharacterized protein LOC110702320 [Chenopodium quinoa]|uniref:uncharacterized protein LOC110702320 n=1 Tax=Chenopodium quinoa TaxID=63459 RepID=UPI000B785110|nr:uncharacterized protein LOC110702320 [Chenopodium quinoa]